jgi:hypothetical protein
MSRSSCSCRKPDIRKFDGIRTCLSCGVAVFETSPAETNITSDVSEVTHANRDYDYRKLNFDLGQEIRLVVVQPGESSEPIRCEIIHVNLEDDPEYAAVSYTWADEDGCDDQSQRIYCLDGTSIPVTANCEAALRRLREPGLKRRLWIDAICINQKHISECNHQVGLMDRIYSKASKVFICIRDLRSDHQLAMSWLKGTDDRTDEDNVLFVNMEALLSLRWFSRVWVVQEVALANAAFLLVNQATIFLSPEVLERLRLYCHSQYLRVPGPLRWSVGSKEKYNLITCLDATRSCLSKDPRDKIYAVLSLMEPTIRKLIPIDYSKDLDWIKTTVSVAAVVHDRNLDILSQVTSGHVASKPSSWVPDWTSLAVSRKPIDQFEKSFNQDLLQYRRRNIPVEIADERFKGLHSGMAKPAALLTMDRRPSDYIQILQPVTSSQSLIPRLRVRAHLLATIPASKRSIFGVNCWEFCNKMESDVSVLQHNSWILKFFRKTPRQSAEKWSHMQRGPLEKLLHEDEQDTLRVWNLPQRFPHYVYKEIPYNLHDLASFLRDGRRWGEGRYLFETNNSVGFTNGNHREGDQVFAIDGAKSPFILRRVSEEKNQYKIVSDCYLWAALELDYWNPGTRKGFWEDGDDRQPREEQTRMIELL